MASTDKATPVKVGVLFSQTGVTSIVEQTQLNATLLAIEEMEDELRRCGRAIEPIIFDPSSQPQKYRFLSERLLGEQRAALIFGCYMSSARRAVIPVVEKWNSLLIYPTFYEGFEYSKNVIYAGAVPNQTNIVLAKYILENHGSKIYCVGSNYIFPRESNRLMRNVFSREGGTVVQESYLPLGASPEEIDRLIEDILAHRPDAVFLTVVGLDIAKFYQRLSRRRITADDIPVISITTTEAELSLLNKGEATGHICVAPYFQSVNTTENRKFIARYNQRFPAGPPVNMCAEAAYFSTLLVSRALISTEFADPQSILKTLQNQETNAPQGLVKMDDQNNHFYLNYRIGRINGKGIDIIRESVNYIKPDPYMVEFGGSFGSRVASHDLTAPVEDAGEGTLGESYEGS